MPIAAEVPSNTRRIMESLVGIKNSKSFLIQLSTGEQNVAVESVCKLLDHPFIINAGSAAEKVRGWSFEKEFVDLDAELGRDGRESEPLWLEKGGGSRSLLAWR